VRFTEPDTETAGERNSARDRAKCGCGVVYGGLLELVLGSALRVDRTSTKVGHQKICLRLLGTNTNEPYDLLQNLGSALWVGRPSAVGHRTIRNE
jgi:hypothetical protein